MTRVARIFTPSHPVLNVRRRIALCLVLAGVTCVITGCRPPVFGPNEDRSQFDRFDQARDSRAQTLIEDEFGRKIPNLRKRLVYTE